jgi:hypothetical protein
LLLSDRNIEPGARRVDIRSGFDRSVDIFGVSDGEGPEWFS